MKISLRRSAIFLCVCVVCIVFMAWGAMKLLDLLGGYSDGKYSKQGNQLLKSIDMDLISRGFCSTVNECKTQLEVYGEHGNRINYSIYGPKNRNVLAAFIGFVVENGTEITGGVPISISVYPKSSEQYGNPLVRGETMIKVEVTQ